MNRPLSPAKNAPEHDVVYTPRELAKLIIDHFQPTGIILDPCKGDGAFHDQFPEGMTYDWCEIDQGRDFFDYQSKVDWIITNPPWSKIKEFITHGIEVADEIVYLITINHIMTKARMRIILQSGFGIKEIFGVSTPKKNWPQSGFQLAAVHLSRGYTGPTTFSGEFGN